MKLSDLKIGRIYTNSSVRMKPVEIFDNSALCYVIEFNDKKIIPSDRLRSYEPEIISRYEAIKNYGLSDRMITELLKLKLLKKYSYDKLWKQDFENISIKPKEGFDPVFVAVKYLYIRKSDL